MHLVTEKSHVPKLYLQFEGTFAVVEETADVILFQMHSGKPANPMSTGSIHNPKSVCQSNQMLATVDKLQ